MLLTKNTVVACAASLAVTLSGCASMSDTTTTSYAYEIYNVEAKSHERASVENAMIAGIKTRLTKVNVQKNPPPYPMPAAPGRFQTQQIGVGTGMGAMAAMAGSSLPMIAACPGASVVVHSNDDDFSAYGENTRYTFCLWEYEGGYHVDTFASYTSRSGIVADPNVLGAQLGRALAGDSSKLIPMVMKEIRTKLEQTGAKITVVDSYNPFEKKG